MPVFCLQYDLATFFSQKFCLLGEKTKDSGYQFLAGDWIKSEWWFEMLFQGVKKNSNLRIM